MTSVQLRAFLSFAAAGSFAGAAAATGVAQATLHRAVGDLERLTGLGLYRRAGRGVQLSTEGRAVARGMRRAIARSRPGSARSRIWRGREVGAIRIGAMPLSRAALVPEAIARFRRARPGIDVEVVDGAYADLMEPLKDGEVDFLIGALRGRDADPAGAEAPLFDDLLSIVAGPDHPLVGVTKIGAAELAGFPWIVAPRIRRITVTGGGSSRMRAWRRRPIRWSAARSWRSGSCLRSAISLPCYPSTRSSARSGPATSHCLGRRWRRPVEPIGLTIVAGFRPTPFQYEMLDLVRTVARERNSGN